MVWWSTPAAPLFAITRSLAAYRLAFAYTLSISVCHRPPLTPVWSAVNMRSVQTQRFAHSLIGGGSSAGVALNGTVTRVCSQRLVISHSPSCVPFAPPALPGIFATTDALTPDG